MNKFKSLLCLLPISVLVLLSFLSGSYAEVVKPDENEIGNINFNRAIPAEITNSIRMKLRLIPTGSFMMGATPGDHDAWDHEKPRHRVKITKPFYISAYEVTQSQYKAVMRKNPSIFKGVKRPVDYVSWNEAEEFCQKLSRKEKAKYRLPTEAEWEYACRAGTRTKFYWGEADPDDYAWHHFNSGLKTHKVGLKLPNAWGLYDMSGNVMEWCADRYREDYYSVSPLLDPRGPSAGLNRVIRSERWDSFPGNLRSSWRNWDYPGVRVTGFGFRVVREVE
jgi:formylglycine-generating enzyme required for sulfatase activity